MHYIYTVDISSLFAVGLAPVFHNWLLVLHESALEGKSGFANFLK